MIEMAQFNNIKFLKEVEGLSQRKIATKLCISRNTVSKYLKENIAPTTILRKTVYGMKDYAPETKRVIPIIDQWLEDAFLYSPGTLAPNDSLTKAKRNHGTFITLGATSSLRVLSLIFA